MNNEQLFKVKEAAEFMNISKSKLYQMISDNKISCYEIEGGIRLSENQIIEYLSNNEKKGNKNGKKI